MRRRAIGLAVALLAACAGGGERRDFDAFSVEVPRGWTAAAYGKDDARAGRPGFAAAGAGLYGPAGEYVEVLVDVGMGPPDADSWWPAEAGPDGRLVLKERRGLCRKAAAGTRTPDEDLLGLPSCLAGDGRLDAETSFDAGGHGYVLLFGNTRREEPADLAALARVLETCRAR